MGFLRSLFGGGTPSRSPNAVKFAGAMSAYLQALNILFLANPIENQIRDPRKRKLILSFLMGSADFLGRHVQKMPDDTVLAGFAAALEMGLGLSSSQAQKACDEAAVWSGEHDGGLYMQQGAKAFEEFMANKTPPSKNLRIMLAFSDPVDLRQFLEDGADFDGLMKQSG